MPQRLLPPERVLALLTENPRRIAAFTARMTPRQLRTPPTSGAWSANDVLAHLRSCADVWGGCVTAITATDEPAIRAVNPRTWIKSTGYLQLEFASSWHAYLAQRAELLALLAPLPRNEWSRAATVTGAGAPLRRTVHTYAQWLARHEHSHVRQFEHIAAAFSGR